MAFSKGLGLQTTIYFALWRCCPLEQLSKSTYAPYLDDNYFSWRVVYDSIQQILLEHNSLVVHEEIDVLCNLNVEDLEISAPLASTHEHVLVFGGIAGTIADALERRQDVIVRTSPI